VLTKNSNHEKAPDAGQGNEGTTETPHYEGTIPMTVLNRLASRTLQFPAAIRLNMTLGRNLRAAASDQGFTRATLQATTGDTWINTQRAWLGLRPMVNTVLMAQLAIGSGAASIWPSSPTKAA
jgi:hypothetical protein